MRASRKIFSKGGLPFTILVIGGGIFLVYLTFKFVPSILATSYDSNLPVKENLIETASASFDENLEKKDVWKATHVKTPESVKAIYMTSWIAGTPSLRQRVLNVIDTTEINAVMIDIKDDTGMVSFDTQDEVIKELGWEENRIPNLRDLIAELHEKDIYVLGRIAVFQDPYMTKRRPDLAVKRASDTSVVWTDRKGLSWIDPSAKEHWDNIIRLARASYRAGFDEINFDYIRFPSDGNVSDMYFPWSGERLAASSHSEERAFIIRDFFKYLSEEIRKPDPETRIPFEGKISADIFGMTTTAEDNMGIGQILEFTLPYFDYVAPMVYPSHFPSGYYGISNVNSVPGKIIEISMGEAVRRAQATTTTLSFLGGKPIASTSPQLYTKKAYDPDKLRPWLQDNDYPVHYDASMVRAQIDATYSVGLDSWMLWDPANTYTVGALRSE